MDKSANRVHLRWLPFVARLDDMGSYSWGAAVLTWLYRCMCRVANRNVTNLAGPLQLLQSWIFWRFPTLRPPDFDAFSFPLVSRVFPQLGDIQHLPEPALNIEYLHSKNGRGEDRWFPTYYRTWHQHWDERVRSVLSVHRVPDPGPSPEYLDWWHRVAHRILSPGVAFADPRPT
ncbi:hypothetical protein Ahy_B02g058230 [Arachis hypogaea]|uniref:Aminotransferase-like plant mobile domain-containing protein n=1 Tax=Arachis hypogaea TaxID=3818 RepID=A0A445AE73_ARAHY|nr:hypothetical protein Ahy_B02g058230 [Arachis hypogaea]